MAKLSETIYVRVDGGGFKARLAAVADDLGISVAAFVRQTLTRELDDYEKFVQVERSASAPAQGEPE